MRRAWLAVVLVAVVGAGALLAAALNARTDLAFTLGVFSGRPSSPIPAGATACQGPITVPEGGSFDRIDFPIGTYYLAGPAVEVSVRALDGSFLERRGLLKAGYPDIGLEPRQAVQVGTVPDNSLVEVCFRNRGPRPVALFGHDDPTHAESSGTIEHQLTDLDFDLVFRRDRESFASLLPDIARRASLFAAPWSSPGLLYALIALLLLGAPLLLIVAIRSLARDG